MSAPPNGMRYMRSGIVIKECQPSAVYRLVAAAGTWRTTNTESFNSTLNLQGYSTDGGNTFQSAYITAPVQITVANASSSTDNSLYDTEMTSMSATLPSGAMIRTSPTEPSRGVTEIDAQSDGTFRISSFFDIFTELSLDGGNTWSADTNGPVRMQLTQQAPEVPTTTPNLPVTSQPLMRQPGAMGTPCMPTASSSPT